MTAAQKKRARCVCCKKGDIALPAYKLCTACMDSLTDCRGSWCKQFVFVHFCHCACRRRAKGKGK